MSRAAREVRIHGSLLAEAEKRLLVRMAAGMPVWVTSDGLTALGAAAMLGAGAAYASVPFWSGAPLAAVFLLGVNWFGDSLDGTLARVRRRERPRYGFYVDHVLDAAGILCLIGGMIAGGVLSTTAGAAFLVAYYLLLIEIALATHALGTFRMAYWRFGPTELRIVVALGTLQLLRSPWSSVGGHPVLLFDIGAWVAAAVLLATFLVTAAGHTRALYRLEPL